MQLFIAELAFDEEGAITGIEREVQITDNDHVNWAPFWHPSGRFLLYSTSEVGHFNYEVFAVEVKDERGRVVRGATPVRITHAAGFDGLPVFNRDGSLMMWTSQRGESGTSQVWVAEFDAGSLLESEENDGSR